MRHARYRRILGAIFVLPIIAVLGFLDVIPVSDTVAWLALAAFIVGVVVYFVKFKDKDKGKGYSNGNEDEK